jgi:hypothetical protein
MRGSPGACRVPYGPLEPCDRREHATGVATPHHSQVAKDFGEAAPAQVAMGSLRPREIPIRRFMSEGHDAVAEATQGLKGDGVQRVVRSVLVPQAFMQIFLLPAAGGATPGDALAGSKKVDEGGIPENVTWLWPDVAVAVPTNPGQLVVREPRCM